MKKMLFGGVALIALALGGSVHAADAPAAKPVAFKATTAIGAVDWTGLYVGVHAGYAWGTVDYSNAQFVTDQSSNLDPNGWFGGFQVGYNRPFAPNWIIGFEADISRGNLRESGLTSPSAVLNEVKIDNFGTARTRIGYLHDRILVYATGGLAWAQETARVPGGFFHLKSYHVGWAAGAGAEYALDPRWSTKIEYLYADLGSIYTEGFPTAGRKVDLTLSTVKVGLNYRFSQLTSSATVPTGMPVKAPVAAVRTGWTGGYLGLHTGYAWGDFDAFDASPIPDQTASLDPTGWFGGFQSGYNWQFAPNWVVGLETDVAFGSVRDSGLTSPSGFAATVKVDQFGTVRARLGYAMDRTLIYATGGLAWAHEKYNSGVGAGGTLVADVYKVGWTAGGGLEYALNPNWSAKIEYLYADLGRFSDVPGTVNASSTDLKLSTVKAGINYRFAR